MASFDVYAMYYDFFMGRPLYLSHPGLGEIEFQAQSYSYEDDKRHILEDEYGRKLYIFKSEFHTSMITYDEHRNCVLDPRYEGQSINGTLQLAGGKFGHDVDVTISGQRPLPVFNITPA